MRILLIEDHPIVRSACRRLLQGRRGIEVAEAASAADGLQVFRTWCPDTVLLDLKLPDGNGLALLAELLSQAPAVQVIVFSMYDDPAFAARALQAGAKGYMTKNDDPDTLLRAIDRVAAGGIFLTPAMEARLAAADGPNEGDVLRDLSLRECQVLRLLSHGRTLAEIADELGVAYRTSAYIVAQLKAKLGIASTAALIRWAVEHGQAGGGQGGLSGP